jgi:GDP-D-mannose dehydratase
VHSLPGSGGQGGSFLAELLLERKYDICGVVRDLDPRRYPNIAAIYDRVEWVAADPLDKSSLPRLA